VEKIITLLWILFGIGAFVFRMIKKAQETTVRESQERPTRPGRAVPGLPAATFQDMLRQMQARNAADPNGAPAPEAPPVGPPPAAPRTLGGRLLPREVARPIRSQERIAPRRPSLEAPATARPRNAPAPPARRSSALPRASAEAPMDGNRPAAARPAATLNETVREMLRRPESVRTAFVLSEIFQRKHQ